MVGVDVLLKLAYGAQADHGATTKPERGHGAVLIMQADEELMQTASVDDILQVSIPGEQKIEH